MSNRKTLLVTGAAGLVGTGIRAHLAETYDLVLFTRRMIEDLPDGCRLTFGDMTDPNSIDKAVKSCDAVLHLAAVHGLTISFEETLEVNYRGTIALMDAVVRHNVSHVVFASSNHGWGFYPISETPLAETAPPRPDGWYAINKIWAEAVMAYYADAHGLVTTSLRIGNANTHVLDERRTHMWLSYRDFAALVRTCVERKDTGHRTAFAVADCAEPYFDNSAMGQLGYPPSDRPEENLAPEYDPRVLTHGLVGGTFAEANLFPKADRP